MLTFPGFTHTQQFKFFKASQLLVEAAAA